jgi:hypothetical protein
MKLLKHAGFLTVAVALTMAVKVSAGENAGTAPAVGILSTVATAELPAKAAELIAQADAKSLKITTISVVKAAVGLNPAAAPAIVGSIAQTTPEMAGIAAATATALVPSEALAIARSAAAAAPSKAGAIVEAMCRVLPADYQKIAVAVSEVVPGSAKDILTGIVAAIPELKTAINQTLAGYNGTIPSVSAVLTQVGNTAAMAAISPGNGLPMGPASRPPLVPISGTPPVVNPGNGQPVVSPTGHDYSAPPPP